MRVSRLGRWRHRSRAGSRRCRTALPGCSFRALLPVAPDQVVRRAVVVEVGLVGRLKLRNDLLRQDLAQLDAPLIEGVDPPDRSLGEDRVFVQRYERAE